MNTQSSRSSLDVEYYSLRNMYLSVFVVKMLYIYIGMMLVWTSPLIPNLEATLQTSTMENMMILASLPVGMMIGPMTGNILVPRYGFKSVFLEFGCLSLVSVLLLSFRQVLQICIGRLTAGVAIGAVLCYVEAYIQDISDVSGLTRAHLLLHVKLEVRTLMNPLTLVFLAIGIFLVYDIGQILLYYEMLIILMITPVVFLICLTWLPESPCVYIVAGSLEKAKKSFELLHRGISTRGLDYLTQRIQENVSKREVEVKDRANVPSYHTDSKTANITLAFFTLLPLTGFPVVFMLMETLVSEAQQHTAVSSSLSTIARVDLCPTPVALVLNYYCNQKLKMIGSSVFMSLSMMALGIYFLCLESGKDITDVFWVPLISIVIYTVAFLVGFVHKPDDGLSDPRFRDCGRVLILTIGFFSMTLVVLLFFPIKAALGIGPVLLGFSGFSVLLTVFISIYSPDATLF